jgi:hypothetical protein
MEITRQLVEAPNGLHFRTGRLLEAGTYRDEIAEVLLACLHLAYRQIAVGLGRKEGKGTIEIASIHGLCPPVTLLEGGGFRGIDDIRLDIVLAEDECDPDDEYHQGEHGSCDQGTLEAGPLDG